MPSIKVLLTLSNPLKHFRLYEAIEVIIHFQAM